MVKTASSSSSSTSEQQASEPKYTGVRKRKWGKWVSEIRLPNSRERIWLGSYDSPEKAARAFDAALYCLRGARAKFNFPHNPPHIVGGDSLSPQEIQVVAARFANETSTSTSTSTSTPEPSSTSDGAIQMEISRASDHLTGIDWSFLNVLDLNEGVSNFGIYAGLDNMGSDYYPSIFYDGNGDNGEDHDDDGNQAYSHSSFLWNF